jgi:uncharacterized membrane protein YraQ (UPF0718 family)
MVMYDFIREFWTQLVYIFLEMSPYVLLGLLFAGILKMTVPEGWITRVAGKKHLGVPVLTSLIGVPLPLCSCSVLPFALGLKKQGANKGAVLAFLTSTPQTGVDSVLVAYSFFGLPFALYKVAVSFVSGTLAGWFSNWFGNGTAQGSVGDGSSDAGTDCASIAGDTSGTDGSACCTSDDCCAEDSCTETVKSRGRTGWRKVSGVFAFAFDELLGDFALVFLLGIVGSALLSAILPDYYLQGFSQRWLYYPAMLLISVPLYVCATASVPIAFALVQAGIPPGAAMVLLIAGPATNIATLGVVGKVLGKKNVLIYLLTIAGSAVIGGILFDRIFGFNANLGSSIQQGFEFPFPAAAAAAVLLALLLLFHIVKSAVIKARKTKNIKNQTKEAAETDS